MAGVSSLGLGLCQMLLNPQILSWILVFGFFVAMGPAIALCVCFVVRVDAFRFDYDSTV